MLSAVLTCFLLAYLRLTCVVVLVVVAVFGLYGCYLRSFGHCVCTRSWACPIFVAVLVNDLVVVPVGGSSLRVGVVRVMLVM